MFKRDGILATRNMDYTNLEFKGNSKLVIDCYHKKINIPNSIMLLMEGMEVVLGSKYL